MKPCFSVNGHTVDLSGADPHLTLLNLLREKGFTGSKMGCNEGDCGACTVLLLEEDSPPRSINSCLALVGSLVGRSVITAEGLDPEGELHPVQKAMIDQNGSQCGYCTPGFVCSMAEATARGVQKDPAEVADQLCGNLCRCTGYRPIREAMEMSSDGELPERFDLPSVSLPDYHRPQSVAEALALRGSYPEAPFIAGATELAVLINKRHERYSAFISLEEVSELQTISSTDTDWQIGAAAVLTDVAEALMGEYPALHDMLRRFASRQIRHRATLGGNLVTASPIGDSAPVLLALDAQLTLQGSAERVVAIKDFFTGYRETVMHPGELLTKITLPRSLPGQTRFYKVSKRREMDISTVAAAIRIATDQKGIITEARLAYGGVAATPTRANQTEAALIGLPLAEAASSAILNTLASEFAPLDDLRGSSDYRNALITDLFLKYLAGEEDTIETPRASRFQAGKTTSFPHESAALHVTGRARYVDDEAQKLDTLTVWTIRSEHAHAQFRLSGLEVAREAPGVHTVLTADDVPGLNNTGPARHDEPLFAIDGTVHYHGQLIVAVVAETAEQGRLAAELVTVEYDPLPALLGLENAIAAQSFLTEPHVLSRGEVNEALSEAPHRLAGSLAIGGQEHFYLETHAAMSTPEENGGVFVQSSTQHPSEIQSIVAEVLDLSRQDVVVECPRMGGGFGGKETQGNVWAALTALAAVKTQRRVSVQLDRDLDME
ncbi:MAG: FAD binding domain-containing protein, partial [Verrucomicrobiota bacterium]